MGLKSAHARKLADLIERPAQDQDPEAEAVSDEGDQSSDDSSDGEAAGTEHYEAVGQSKLRRNAPLVLGPRYRGARVSREALEDDDEDEDEEEDEEIGEDEDEDEDEDEEIGEDEVDDDSAGSSNYEDALEEFDDPDTADPEADQQGQEDVEIDSDEAFREGDEEGARVFALKAKIAKQRHAQRPRAADFMGSESEDEDEDEDGNEDYGMDEDEDEDELSDDLGINGFIDDEAEESSDEEVGLFDDEDDEEEDEEEDEEDYDDEEEEEEEEEGDPIDHRKKPKPPNSAGITASIKEMMGEQGVVRSLAQAVNADVQKGQAVQRQRKGFDALLNLRIRLQKSIIAVNSLSYADEPESPEAEPYEAAEKSALQLWNALDDFRTSIRKGTKRKHDETEDISTTTLWGRMEQHEKYQAARRKQVLEKWSRDVKKTSITANSSHKFTNNAEKPIISMLSDELDAPERLIKRTRTPRSCAPYQAAQKINEDESIYDDADFYQLLLKELVDHRSGDGSGTGLQAATIRYAAAKEAKAKRHVDTKASKGRKMRFAPIPKLQNFMAPEDRRSWEQNAIDLFFGTLFGQKMALSEEISDEEMGGTSLQDEGLRLFRS
ncbi:apoptosis-antagonizing transcription factor [Nemania sp. FL0916]|nr:apoptosis-antagonizing transcription factor [Nemania sp. FL0916]